MIPNQRSLFSIPDEISYLNCAYTSPLLRSAEAAGKKAVAAKACPWQITPAHFFSLLEPVREKFGQIIQCPATDVAVIPSVSYGMALAAKNIPLEQGQKILVLEDQFPSNIYSWQRRTRKKKASITTVKRPKDFNWTQAVLEAITPKTAIVALPHCHWTDGSCLDLAIIGQHCRDMGAALCIDATQSLGAMPLSIEQVRPDFLVTTAHKWLLGPYSYGFCYVAPQWQEGIPLEENWMNRQGSKDFSRLVDYRNQYQAGARRFEMGEASNFFLSPIVDASLGQILDWGVTDIAAALEVKTDEIAQKAENIGLTVPPKKMRSPHLIGVTLPRGIPQGLGDQLATNSIYVSIRGDAIRIAPHLYTTQEDISRLFDLLAAC